MRKAYSGLLLTALAFIPLISTAADRPQNIGIDDYSMPLMQIARNTTSDSDLAMMLKPGSILGYDTYRKSTVIERDPATGNVSLNVSGHKVEIRPDTREIIEYAE